MNPKSKKPQFEVNDFVTVKGLHEDDNRGLITAIRDGKAHVSSMNMPFCGSICDWFAFDQLELRKSRNP